MALETFICRLIPIFAVALSLLAMYTDFRWRIIPNWLTLPGIGIGLIINFACNSWQGLQLAGFGFLVGFALMLLPFLIGGMGAGDVKLMAALGSLLGAYAILNVFLYATVIGGLLAAIIALKKKTLGKSLVNLAHIVIGVFLFRSLSERGEVVDKNVKVPYGLAVGTGALCYLLIGAIV
jgi:prepilin peptidase CpaA